MGILQESILQLDVHDKAAGQLSLCCPVWPAFRMEGLRPALKCDQASAGLIACAFKQERQGKLLTSRYEFAGKHILTQMFQTGEDATLRIRSTLRNDSAKPMVLNEVTLLQADPPAGTVDFGTKPEDVRLLEQGSYWGRVRGIVRRTAADESAKAGEPNSATGEDKSASGLVSVAYDRAARMAFLAGFVTSERWSGHITLNTTADGAITAWRMGFDGGDVRVNAGEEIALEEVVLAFGPDPWRMLEQYADAAAAGLFDPDHRSRRPDETPGGGGPGGGAVSGARHDRAARGQPDASRGLPERPRMTNRMRWVWLLALLAATGEGRALVPLPSETPARIVVSGRTSTAVDIKIVKVGQEIPETYSDRPVPNTPGFEWYVSQHYALKTQMDEDFSRMMLEVSELALPHWKSVTGLEPPDPDNKRMLIVYAKSAADIVRAIQGDLGFTWNVNGGGVTWWSNWGAYNYPGGGMMYHLKDLVIHENLHMLQGVALKNNMGTEGYTYGGAQHVYDPARKQLTVMVFDRAPINNFTDQGLTALHNEFIPLREMAEKHSGNGALGAVYTHFFWSDPDRYLKLRIWRDEFYAGRLGRESNVAVMEDIFGSLDRLNLEWERWVNGHRATFHHVTWSFEQEGAWLWSRPSRNNDYTRMDLNEIPGEVPRPDPLRMDYPREPAPPTVGPIRRGPRNPAIGCELDLSKHPDVGRVGMAFGVEDEGSAIGGVKVVIEDGRRLVVDAAVWGRPDAVFEIPESFRNAVAADAHRLGMTVTIGREALNVALRARNRSGTQEPRKGMLRLPEFQSSRFVTFTAGIPLTPEQRERLLWRKMSLLSKLQEGEYFDLQFGIQPFLDALPVEQVDLTKPAPANRWRFAGMDRLETLYRAAWRLKDKAPESLLTLRADMLAAVDKNPATQAKALRAYEARIARVAADVAACGAGSQALIELAGLDMTFDARAGAEPCKLALEARVRGRMEDAVSGTVTLAVEEEGNRSVTAVHPLGTLSRRASVLAGEITVADASRPILCSATADVRWHGVTFSLTQTQLVVNASSSGELR